MKLFMQVDNADAAERLAASITYQPEYMLTAELPDEVVNNHLDEVALHLFQYYESKLPAMKTVMERWNKYVSFAVKGVLNDVDGNTVYANVSLTLCDTMSWCVGIMLAHEADKEDPFVYFGGAGPRGYLTPIIKEMRINLTSDTDLEKASKDVCFIYESTAPHDMKLWEDRYAYIVRKFQERHPDALRAMEAAILGRDDSYTGRALCDWWVCQSSYNADWYVKYKAVADTLVV